jgi:hypothetical protein
VPHVASVARPWIVREKAMVRSYRSVPSLSLQKVAKGVKGWG